MSFRTAASALAVVLLSASIPVPTRAALVPLPVITVQVLTRPTASVPIGAQRVLMLTVQMTADCPANVQARRDVLLRSLTLLHRGLGDPSDIERIYGFSDGLRRTRTTTVSSRGYATLYFGGVQLKSCSTMSMDILADIRSTAAASSEHGFEIADEKSIVTEPQAKIALNPAGAAGLTIPVGKALGTVSVQSLSLPNTLTYGSARTVARLRLDTVGRDDQLIRSITFVNDGSARDADLQNLFLETSGHSRLSPTVPSLQGDRVMIVLDPPLLLRRSESRVVQLLGDVRASRRRTVRLIIQEASDVDVTPAR